MGQSQVAGVEAGNHTRREVIVEYNLPSLSGLIPSVESPDFPGIPESTIPETNFQHFIQF